MEEVALTSYLGALLAVMVISVSALAVVLHLLPAGFLNGRSARYYQLFFWGGALSWLLLALMEAGWLPMRSVLLAVGYLVNTGFLFFATVGPFEKPRTKWTLAAIHLIAVLGLFFIEQDRHKLLAVSLYVLPAYALIAWASLARGRRERNVGHVLFGVAAVLVLLALPVQVAFTAFFDRFDIAFTALLLANSSGYMLFGIGLLSSVVASQFRRLSDLALRDPLTGLLNRRGLNHALVAVLGIKARLSLPVCVIAMDIDHFKAINDTHGHDGGDAVLKAFGGLVAQHARASDVCARLGGEEFVAVLANSDLTGGMRTAERIRGAVEQMEVRHGARPIRLTCSFGVASSVGQIDLDALLKTADGALYAAKESGRNAVCSAS